MRVVPDHTVRAADQNSVFPSYLKGNVWDFPDIIGGLPGSGTLWRPTEGGLFAKQHAVETQGF